MPRESLSRIKVLLTESINEIANHAFQNEVNSIHLKRIKDNLIDMLSICKQETESVSPVIASRTRLDYADKTHILKIAYVMSRFDYPLLNNILSTHYNQTETLNYLEKLTGVKSTTLKNIRDRFDPYVKQERSNRRGWYQVQLTPDYLEIKAEYDDKGEEFIAEEIKNILQLFK